MQPRLDKNLFQRLDGYSASYILNNHIVIACPSCGSSGSVSNVAIKQASELSKYFEKVTLISDSLPEDLPKKIRRRLVTPHRFDCLRRFCHVPNEYSFAHSVRKQIEKLHAEQKINMVICHGHALATLAAKPMKEKYGVPYALVSHGDIFDRPKGTYDSRLTAFYKAVTPSAYRNADLIIALSPYMADCAVKGGANPDVVHVIPNGIDPEDIGLDLENISTPSTTNHINNPLKLLYVGGLTIPKGVNVLISACKILKGKYIPFILQLIGTGTLEAKLKKIVIDMDLSKEILFLGKIERKNLGKYYQNADLVIVPSINDPLPTVVLEALIAGTPVIGSNIGGIPFMVTNKQNGMLVDPGKPGALAEVVESLFTQPENLSNLQKNAYPSVFPKFSWESVGSQIYNLIKEKLKSNEA